MIRIANGQGFWGDSIEAPVEQVRRGPIDYLTLDYLAEVTMSILQKQRRRDPRAGYARDFVELIERVLPDFSGVCLGVVERYELPNLGALDFPLHDSLDGGGTLALRADPQGKTFSTALLRMMIEADR